MGAPKALMRIQGEPAVVRLARIFSQIPLEQIIITVPKFLLADAKLRYLLADMPVEILPNLYDSLGYAGSIKTALEKLDSSYDGLIITPVDAPFTSVSLVRNIIYLAENKSSPKIIVPKYYASAGHPVYISKKYFSKLKSCFELGGLKVFIAKNFKSLKILYWPDQLILANLNSPTNLSFVKLSGSSVVNFREAHYEFSTAPFRRITLDIATKTIHGHFAISETHASAKLGSGHKTVKNIG